MDFESIIKSYQLAKRKYEELGIDTEKALEKLLNLKISLNCWQGDDVRGFINKTKLTGGIAVTGNYPGRARNIKELQNDLEYALNNIAGNHKVSLHSIYADVEGDGNLLDIGPENFRVWVEWAKKNNIGLDFNPTLFSHPNSDTGFTLSSYDEKIRDFWIEHIIKSREISEYFGKELNQRSINNIWIPDGYKDNPIDRVEPRKNLLNSLDKALSHKINEKYSIDSVEGKIFGIGAESYTTGTHEFYLSYALTRNILWTIDSGHFHPTECPADKIASVAPFNKEIFLHISRPVRWDSDHVVILDDNLRKIMETIVNNSLIDKVNIGLDFFDASINRVAGWIIGARSIQKAYLEALLTPLSLLKEYEINQDYTSRLAMKEELKTFPVGSVWEYFCMVNDVPYSIEWLESIKKYEKEVLLFRDN